MFAVPGLGQVQGEVAAAVPGGAGSQVNRGVSAGLAGGTPEGDPVPLALGADGRAAATARLAPPAIHPVLLTSMPVAGGDVAGALLVRVEQAPGQLRYRAEVSHAADGLPRVDAAKEQHFGLVDIADAGQVALIEQCLGDAALRLAPQWRTGRP